MAFSRGPTVIKDGIVFSIDPASSKSYPGSTNVYELTRYGGTTTATFPPFGQLSGGTTVTVPTTGSTTKVFGFDGTNDSLLFANNSATAPLPVNFTSSAFSIESWVKLQQTGSNTIAVIVTRGNPLCDGCDGGFNTMFTNSSTISVRFDATGGSNIASVSYNSSSYDFRDDKFHHIVGLRDGTNIKLYLDGVEVATNNNDNNVNVNVEDHLYISGWSSYRGEMEVGPVRIYNKALSATEVSINYNAQKHRFI